MGATINNVGERQSFAALNEVKKPILWGLRGVDEFILISQPEIATL